MSTNRKPSGDAMEKVYSVLKTCTVEQIGLIKIEAAKKMRGVHLEVFTNQCNFAIEKKLSGKW